MRATRLPLSLFPVCRSSLPNHEIENEKKVLLSFSLLLVLLLLSCAVPLRPRLRSWRYTLWLLILGASVYFGGAAFFCCACVFIFWCCFFFKGPGTKRAGARFRSEPPRSGPQGKLP